MHHQQRTKSHWLRSISILVLNSGPDYLLLLNPRLEPNFVFQNQFIHDAGQFENPFQGQELQISLKLYTLGATHQMFSMFIALSLINTFKKWWERGICVYEWFQVVGLRCHASHVRQWLVGIWRCSSSHLSTKNSRTTLSDTVAISRDKNIE